MSKQQRLTGTMHFVIKVKETRNEKEKEKKLFFFVEEEKSEEKIKAATKKKERKNAIRKTRNSQSNGTDPFWRAYK